ncbi:MAG: YceI family protein [bacterium]
MKKILLISTSLLAIVAVAAVLYLMRDPAAASAPITAIPLERETEAAPETAPTESGPQSEATAGESETDGAAEEGSTPTPPPTEDATGNAESEVAAEAGAGEARVYQISQADSQVRFELDEDLRGERTTVVGATDQVAGEIAVNLADLSATQIGLIQINARTLATDNSFRNRAIHNEILQTGSYEFITFAPTEIAGLPQSADPGDEVTFTISGDLTIRDVTQSVTFEVTAAALSENELTGLASTTIAREAYGLSIPSVPQVANVEEEVDIFIEFVAHAT